MWCFGDLAHFTLKIWLLRECHNNCSITYNYSSIAWLLKLVWKHKPPLNQQQETSSGFTGFKILPCIIIKHNKWGSVIILCTCTNHSSKLDIPEQCCGEKRREFCSQAAVPLAVLFSWVINMGQADLTTALCPCKARCWHAVSLLWTGTLALLERTLLCDDGILQLLSCCLIHSCKAISESQLMIFGWPLSSWQTPCFERTALACVPNAFMSSRNCSSPD